MTLNELTRRARKLGATCIWHKSFYSTADGNWYHRVYVRDESRDIGIQTAPRWVPETARREALELFRAEIEV